MTQRKIIYDIRERLKFSSDDSEITDEYLAHLVDVKRVFLIKQRFSKFTRNIPEEVKQIICVDMEATSDINGVCDSDTIMVSKEPIPGTLEIGGRSALINVRVNQITAPHLNLVSVDRLPFVGYNKWLKNQIYVALDADNKLYMKNTSDKIFTEKIKVTGVFEDPEAADALSCESSNNCDYLDKTYPIEGYMVSDLVNMIVKELAPGLNIPEDKINNADESNRN